MRDDGQALRAAFGVDPRRLEMLHILTDLGKVRVPADMLAALETVFPA